MTRLAEAYFSLLKLLLILLLAGMVVLVFGNVVLRYAFNSGITKSEELARWFFVWMVFLGAIVGLRERAHLGVDTLIARLPPQLRLAAYILSHVLMIFASVLMAKGSWTQMMINLHVSAPATGLSVGLFYGIGVVFGVSAIAILGHELLRALTGRVSDAEILAIRESEDH